MPQVLILTSADLLILSDMPELVVTTPMAFADATIRIGFLSGAVFQMYFVANPVKQCSVNAQCSAKMLGQYTTVLSILKT